MPGAGRQYRMLLLPAYLSKTFPNLLCFTLLIIFDEVLDPALPH